MKKTELVSLRSRAMTGGGSTLYLDYTLHGIRKREFLRLYIVPEMDKISKIRNAETWKTAKAICAQRVLDLQRGEAGLPTRKEDKLVTEYLDERINYYRSQGKVGYSVLIGNLKAWLVRWGGRITLRTTTDKDILSFIRFAGKSLGPNTLYETYNMLKTQFRAAQRERLINDNPFNYIAPADRPHKVESEREFLTLEELRTLAATKIKSSVVREMFLFSCLTGLRFSDVERLSWDMISRDGDSALLALRQHKTKNMVYIPLPQGVWAVLPKTKKHKGSVWPHRPSRTAINQDIDNWVQRAGITKHISFHCGRHTYATLLLTNDTDLYTVSKLLGHTNISTTQIYAKIVDQKKVDAVSTLPVLEG